MAKKIYSNVIWPLRMNTRGDFDRGPLRKVVRSHIRSVLKTKKFQSLESGGERLMRPGAFGLVPKIVFEIFDVDLMTASIRVWVQDALKHLTNLGIIEILDLRVTSFENLNPPDRGFTVKMKYVVREENFVDEFATDIGTTYPDSQTGVRAA